MYDLDSRSRKSVGWIHTHTHVYSFLLGVVRLADNAMKQTTIGIEPGLLIAKRLTLPFPRTQKRHRNVTGLRQTGTKRHQRGEFSTQNLDIYDHVQNIYSSDAIV